ncbi:TPA: hypothetical protein ACKQDY_000949 [Serratia marcescens]|nr:hypothetical protein [Serratia marcescens]
MKENNLEQLPKSIDVDLWNRPIKVAYLIPIDEDVVSCNIINKVFEECYSRWGGINTLLIPYEKRKVLNDKYLDWLYDYEVDFIYSYVKLNQEDIEELNKITMPIEFWYHSLEKENGSFIPNRLVRYKPVKSWSTIKSPYARKLNADGEKILLTQQGNVKHKDFVPDNFGFRHDVEAFTYKINGVFKTVCYCDEETPENNYVGDARVNSIASIVDAISNDEVLTFSLLSKIHSGNISHPKEKRPAGNVKFQLYIGSSPLDKINFWNKRMISEDGFFYSDSERISEMIIDKLVACDEGFCKSFGGFLEKNVYNYGSQSGCVEIRTSSLTHDECMQFILKIKKFTNVEIKLARKTDELSLPNLDGRHPYNFLGKPDQQENTINKNSKFKLQGPEHFSYINYEHQFLKGGEWILDVFIERYQNDSLYVNTNNYWELCRRHVITQLFTKNPSKINKHHSLSILSSENIVGMYRGNSNKQDKHLKLTSPSDEDIFKLLMCHDKDYYDYRRFCKNKNKYENIKISDKGQQHRGIVSKFSSIYEASSIINNVFIRGLLREQSVSGYELMTLETRVRQIPGKNIEGLIDDEYITNIGKAKELLCASLLDAIEYMVRIGFIEQVYIVRCEYCGNSNRRVLDGLKLVNECDVCATEYITPIDMTWRYAFTPFVLRCLVEHNGLSVVAAVSLLLSESKSKQSVYFPEVNLHSSFDKNDYQEIDIVAVIDGDLVISEVKGSAASFIESKNDQSKFEEKVLRIEPDVAYLIFESVCKDAAQKEVFSQALRTLSKELNIKFQGCSLIKVIVMDELHGYDSYEDLIGYQSGRTNGVYLKYGM